MQPRNISNPGAQVFILAEGSSISRVTEVEREMQPAGSQTTARAQEDGLVSRETLSVLYTSEPRAGRFERGQPELEHDAAQGVGGLNSSDDIGEQQALGPERAKAARADVNFWRET
jgi:hypothetical protein